jgi:hypothetical protein
MYQRMGFSLSIPSSLSNLVKGVAGAVWRGTTVTIPTPIGPQTFNLGDPAQVKQLEAMVKGTKLNVATPRPGTGTNIPRAIEQNVPGGWFTIAAVAAALIFGVGAFAGRRRRA